MKPSEHPEFFRFPAPRVGRGRARYGSTTKDGSSTTTSRWSTQAARRPSHVDRTPSDDGRYILTNGYDWTYFVVDDVPYFVRSLRVDDGDAILVLSDGTEESLDRRPSPRTSAASST